MRLSAIDAQARVFPVARLLLDLTIIYLETFSYMQTYELGNLYALVRVADTPHATLYKSVFGPCFKTGI